MAVETDSENEDRPTRGEIAEYVHDMTGQLAALARQAGLQRTADALLAAQGAIGTEY